MNYFTEYKDIKELTRDVVVKLISEVRVSENKEIVFSCFKTFYIKLLERNCSNIIKYFFQIHYVFDMKL